MIAFLRKRGYYCLRAYGSKGLYDVLAIPPVDPNNPDFHNYPLMIQAKTNNYVKPEERKSLEENKNKWQGFQLIAYIDEKHHIAFRTLAGDKITSI